MIVPVSLGKKKKKNEGAIMSSVKIDGRNFSVRGVVKFYEGLSSVKKPPVFFKLRMMIPSVEKKKKTRKKKSRA